MACISAHPYLGMCGFMQAPHPNSYNTAICAVADRNLEEINFIVSEPDFYQTIIQIGQLIYFKRVNIFATFMDIRMYSDLYRVCIDLDHYGKEVSFYYPEGISDFGKEFNRKFCKYYMEYVNSEKGITIEYVINGKENRESILCGKCPQIDCLYDIQISTTNRVVYIPAILRLNEFPTHVSRYFQVWIPYSKVHNGGENYSHFAVMRYKDKEYDRWFPDLYVMATTGAEEYKSISRNKDVKFASVFRPGNMR